MGGTNPSEAQTQTCDRGLGYTSTPDKNKALLFEQVLERYYTQHQEVLAEAFDDQGPTSERLHHLIDVYFDYIDSNRRYHGSSSSRSRQAEPRS